MSKQFKNILMKINNKMNKENIFWFLSIPSILYIMVLFANSNTPIPQLIYTGIVLVIITFSWVINFPINSNSQKRKK